MFESMFESTEINKPNLFCMMFPGKNGRNNVSFGVFPPLAKYLIQAGAVQFTSQSAGRDRTSCQLCCASVMLYSVSGLKVT